MKRQSRLTSQQQQEEIQTQGQAMAHQPLEFESAEAMLRHDALHTPVPPAIECRLQDSLSKETVNAPAPWWKKLFGS